MIFANQQRLLVYISTWILIVSQITCSLNLGLISGDHRRLTRPLVIKKNLRHSPITINIHSAKSPLKLSSPLRSLKLPSKLKALPKLKPVNSKLLKLPSKIPKIPRIPMIPGIFPILPPIIPKLPLLPLPLLPIIPPLPLLPLPILPRVPKPLKIPILRKKTNLQRALDSQMKSIIKIPSKLNKNILKTLLDLKKRGSLTTAEFLRFKKLLL